MENAQDREGHQRVAAAQPRWPPVGVAAAARHPVDGERGRCLQREPTVRQPFRFEQPQRIRAARIAEAPEGPVAGAPVRPTEPARATAPLGSPVRDQLDREKEKQTVPAPIDLDSVMARRRAAGA